MGGQAEIILEAFLQVECYQTQSRGGSFVLAMSRFEAFDIQDLADSRNTQGSKRKNVHRAKQGVMGS